MTSGPDGAGTVPAAEAGVRPDGIIPHPTERIPI